MSVTILTDVPTSELRFGDRVQHSDGNLYKFIYVDVDTEAEPSEYAPLIWLDGKFEWETTARPFDTWPLVVRDDSIVQPVNGVVDGKVVDRAAWRAADYPCQHCALPGGH